MEKIKYRKRDRNQVEIPVRNSYYLDEIVLSLRPEGSPQGWSCCQIFVSMASIASFFFSFLFLERP
jgi:hypothetical protein